MSIKKDLTPINNGNAKRYFLAKVKAFTKAKKIDDHIEHDVSPELIQFDFDGNYRFLNQGLFYPVIMDTLSFQELMDYRRFLKSQLYDKVLEARGYAPAGWDDRVVLAINHKGMDDYVLAPNNLYFRPAEHGSTVIISPPPSDAAELERDGFLFSRLSAMVLN